LPTDLFAADIIGGLVGLCKSHEHTLADHLGDPDVSAYDLLFSFSSPGGKNEFLNLVRSNEDIGEGLHH
jgi:hypothetical protein